MVTEVKYVEPTRKGVGDALRQVYRPDRSRLPHHIEVLLNRIK